MPVWITSRFSTAIGVDDFFTDFHYEEFLECLEALVVNRCPQLSIPSLEHLKKLPSLCVMPQTHQFLRRSHYLTSDSTVAARSLRILQALVTWIGENWTTNPQAVEIYDVFRLVFLPATKSKRMRHSGAARRAFERLIKEVDAKEREHAEQEAEDVKDEENHEMHNDPEEHESPESGALTDIPPIDLAKKEFDNMSYYDVAVPDLFEDARLIWNMVGWMLQCSTISTLEYTYRWKQFKPFLEMVVRFLEIDQQITRQRRENGNSESRKQKHALIEVWTNSGVHHSDILRAILASVNEDGTLDFSPELEGEPDLPSVESMPSPDSALLRSRLLDLVMNSFQGDGTRLSEFIEDSALYFAKEYTHFMLVPLSLFIPCTLGRLAWSVCLDERIRLLYILQSMNLKAVISVLSTKPGRLMFSRPQDSLLCLLKVHIDLISCLYQDDTIKLNDLQKTSLLEAYDRGYELRKQWFNKRLHTSQHSHPPEWSQFESSLQAMIECLE